MNKTESAILESIVNNEDTEPESVPMSLERPVYSTLCFGAVVFGVMRDFG